MARIAGVNVPDRKHVWIALTHIYGIGRTRAFEICSATGVSPDVVVRDLTDTELGCASEEKSRSVSSRATFGGRFR